MSDPPEISPTRPRSDSPTEGSSGEPEERTRTILRRLLFRSRARPTGKPATDEDPEARAATDRSLRELRAEIAFERAEVLEPLLHRLQELGERLSLREEVPAPSLDEGLGLWQAYIERLHDPHIREIAAVAGHGGAEGSDSTLLEIEHDPPRAHARIGEIRAMLTDYAEGYPVFGSLMGPALQGNTRSELAWEQLEEEFLESWAPPPLSALARDRLRSSLAASRRAAVELRRQVQEFLLRSARSASAGRAPSSGGPTAPRAAHGAT